VPLEDGRSLTGFVLLAGGEAGARDVTRFGDWRGLLASEPG
jgi:hypothetical protein